MPEETAILRWREFEKIVPSRRSLHFTRGQAWAAAAVAVLATGLAFGALWVRDVPPPAAPVPATSQNVVALYCQFYVFVESRPFVAFVMEQSPEDTDRYKQAYVAKADGDRTDYNALLDRRPEWRLDRSTDPQRLEARVAVPDSGQTGVAEQEIAIELREFDAARADGVWREASLKSVYYQNLPGKCRQAAARAADQRAEG